MSDDSKKPDAQPDDIDLIALLERGILFFKKYKWVFFVAILIGLLLGLLRYRSIPAVYRSRLVLQSFILSNQNNIQIVNGWDALLKSGECKELAGIFECPEDILSKVKQIKAEEIQKIFASNPNGFTIDVAVTDASILVDLQKGIISGFNNSEYVKDRVAIRRSRLHELIDKTSIEIKRLDSTKKMVENIISGKGTGPSSIIVDGSYNRQLIDMNEKLLFLREELRFSNAVEVLQSFGKFKRPERPNLFIWLFFGLIVSVSIAFCCALLHSLNQKLKKRDRPGKET